MLGEALIREAFGIPEGDTSINLDTINSFIKSENYFTANQGVRAAILDRLVDEAPNNDDMIVVPVGEVTAIDPALSLLTFCVLVLKNGFTLVGKSACADPNNFDEALGRKIARQDAIEQAWPLMGFYLRNELVVREGNG